MEIEVRAIEPSEFEAYARVASHTFGGELDGEEPRDRLLKVLDLDRTYAVFDGPEIVGTGGAFSFSLRVPGASISMAGLTMICVRPTHTRRGVLRAMMAKHEREMIARGEAISGLWASESSIYPRFGYGVAAESHQLEADTRHLRFLNEECGDEIRILELEDCAERFAPIYEAYREHRSGMNARDATWWQWRTLYDGVQRRRGASSLRVAVARRSDRDVGYIMYRQSLASDRAIMAGSATIVELIGIDLQAEASLWSFASRLDLFPRLSWWNAPVDCSLPWLVHDRRQVHRSRTDTLWLHLLDVPAALEGRRYECDGRVSLLVGDDESMTNARSWELCVQEGSGQCRPFGAAPELRLSRQTLSSLYLGAFRVSELAAIGRIEGSREAILRADRLFGTSQAPWCPEVF